MAITPKLREDGSGGTESPWATDLDSVAITKDSNGRTGGTTTLDIDSNGRIALHTDTNNTGVSGYGASSNFADGTIRGTGRIDSDINNHLTLGARKTSSNGTTVGLVVPSNSSTGDNLILRYGTNLGTTSGSPVSKTISAATDYEAVFVFSGTTYKLMLYSTGSFPPGSDYKTATWDISTTDATPTTQSGKVSVGFSRFQTADVNGFWDNVLAWAINESADAPTLAVTGGSAKVTVVVSDASATQKRAPLWYFLRYKASSQPSNETDGTLVTGAGTGLGGSAIRSDGRFIDAPASFDITSLSNGTTYYVRPFAVMPDGTIVAGTSQSATPSAGDTTPPNISDDFDVSYDDPFTDAKLVLTATQPSEAGNYLINYRTDGIDPTGPTDASATVLVTWTAYTANAALSTSATSLTDGTRYRFALWQRDAALNINTGAFAQGVAADQLELVSPADAAVGVQESPYLVWGSQSADSDPVAEDDIPIHFRVEVSTDESSESAFVANRVLDVSSLSDGVSGFEYESSTGVWSQLPADGLAFADAGKDVRYRAAGLIDTGHYYWRVRPQQPGT